MAAVQCDNFVGNAWKKDMCLNCFKSKEEHAMSNGFSHPIITRIPDPPKEGILKGKKSNSSTPKGNKVNFLNTEYEVIGFGGDDNYSEDEDCPNVANNSQTEEEYETESEEDRAFQKLTKTNTDYNSIPENLQEPKEGEVKKIVEPLKLGKQVFDDKGNKKTLLVSVTPFGDQTAIKNKINLNGFKMNGTEAKMNGHHQSSSEDLFKPEFLKKDLLLGKVKSRSEKTETVSNGVVKKSLADVKCVNGEVLEKNENPVKNTQIYEEDNSPKLTNDKSLKRSQPLDKNFKFRLNRNADAGEKDDNTSEKEKINLSEKVNGLVGKLDRLPVTSDAQSFKFRTKEICDSLAKKPTESKAIVLDIYKIHERENMKANGDSDEEKTNESDAVSCETRSKFLPAEVKAGGSVVDAPQEKVEKILNGFGTDQNKLNSTVNESAKIKPDIVENGSSVNISKLIPNVSSLHRHHFKAAKNEGENGKSGSANDAGASLKNGFINSASRVSNTESEHLGNNEKDNIEEKKAGNNVTENLKDQKEAEVELSDEKFKKTSFDSLENFERIIQGEEITLFSAERKPESPDENPNEDKNTLVPEISRESAGEPDDRADSDDLSQPPALPLKPPPPLTESRTNFLHDLTTGSDGIKVSEKPKVPAKPLIIQSKKINFQAPAHPIRAKSPSIEKFLDLSSSPAVKPHFPLQESLSSDSSKIQKRPAPKPPSPKDSSVRYVAVLTDAESDVSEPKQSDQEPIVRDSVKRISTSTENLLELITGQDKEEQLVAEGLEEISVPEPMPRRSLSLSQDSLESGEVMDLQLKKKPSRGRFLLRKLLHLGKPKESTKNLNLWQKSSVSPTSKPKLEIIHPNDLSGSRVEVVPPSRFSKSRRTSSSASSSSGEQRESDVLSDSSTSHSVSSSGNDSHTLIDRAKKPPPPPRGNSLDTWNTKPARPPPPKSIDLLRQANSSWNTSAEIKLNNLYVNLGEARSGLAPNKPVRTGSLREMNAENSKRLMTVTTQPEDSDYESFVVAPVQYSTPSHQSEDNLYECVQASTHRSSLPECDSALTDSPTSSYTKEKRPSSNRNISHRRSDGNVDMNSDYFKIKFIRSASLPYCSSETESEIYSPYSFYGSELGEDDYESSPSSQALRMSRLKLKKGRSIVHKNLEDNYGAVIVANHEALAQVVEQMRQGPSPPPALRTLSTAVNLRWTDFTIPKDAPGVIVERRIFYPALWGVYPVTLSLMAEQGLNSSIHAKGPFNLNPLTELNDLVPASYLPMLKKDDSELIQASISVLTRLQIETIESYGKHVNSGVLSDESKKEVNFVLLQIINSFKTLQAQGIEEAPQNLTNLIVCREERDPHPRVCIIHSFERPEEGTVKTSLCQCVTHAIKETLPPTDLTPLISSVLLKEKAVSLSQAKSILEFSLWGPADIAFGNSDREREAALQRWLDLERATVLHGLVRTRAELTVFEEWQLLFLVRTNAKMMAEASLLLESGVNEEVSVA